MQQIAANNLQFQAKGKECMNESNSEEEHIYIYNYIYKQFTIIIIIITKRFRNFIVKELVYQGVSFSALLITRLDNTFKFMQTFLKLPYVRE